jgi:hypothetical protein
MGATMLVVRREPDRGYYFTVHNRRGELVAISACWPTKAECGEYLRTMLPARIHVEDETC